MAARSAGSAGGGRAGWNKALVRIASTRDPSTISLPDRVLLYDDRTIAIYDAYAKAQYHFLVLPRIPFSISDGEKHALNASDAEAKPALQAIDGKLGFGATTSNRVPQSHMQSISTLLSGPYARIVVDAMSKACSKVVEWIQNDMQQRHGHIWEISTAFHAVPSMEHLHLHVISTDFVSTRLKHKKHFNSFHPTAGFAIPLSEVERLVSGEFPPVKKLPRTPKQYEEILKRPLQSHHTGESFRNMPELKLHLESHWRETLLALPAPGLDSGGLKRKTASSSSSKSSSDGKPSLKAPETEAASQSAPLDSSDEEEPTLSMTK